MSQTTVKEQGVALVGQKYALLKAENVLTLAAEGRVGFGRFVALGTNKELQGKLPGAAGDITSIKAKRGVALQSHAMENAQDGLAPGYLDKTPMSVMSKGAVYVEVEADVDPTDDVFVRHAADGGLDQLGIFAPATGVGLAQLADARWLTASQTVDGKKIAVLELL